jgi:hypothetical protein
MTESELPPLRDDGRRLHPLEGTRACISPLLAGGRAIAIFPLAAHDVADGFTPAQSFLGFEARRAVAPPERPRDAILSSSHR